MSTNGTWALTSFGANADSLVKARSESLAPPSQTDPQAQLAILAEQFVAQELMAHHGPELFYWSREARGSSAEVDFLTVCEGKIYPLEVKSGWGGSLRSLRLMLEKYPECPRGLVFYNGSHGERPDEKLEFRPLYSVASLGRASTD